MSFALGNYPSVFGSLPFGGSGRGGAAPASASQPLSQSPARITGTGLVARFSPIKGITPPSALDRPIWLPAMLDPFDITESAVHNEYDTLSAGHFSQPAMGPPSARQFRTSSLNAIVVDFDAPWLVATGQDPDDIRTRLSEILRARKPVLLLVTFNPDAGRGVEVYMFTTFRSIDKQIRNGELETRYLTIAISEWRDPSVKRRSSNPQGASRAKGATLPTTHTLTATDTLSGLSYAYYGRYDYWRFIRDANGIPTQFGAKTPIVQLPGRWRAGYKVKIPAVSGHSSGVIS